MSRLAHSSGGGHFAVAGAAVLVLVVSVVCVCARRRQRHCGRFSCPNEALSRFSAFDVVNQFVAAPV